MSSLLSTLAIQKYELTLPTTKKKIEYRAFLVKEEKILMLASESKSEEDMSKAIRDVVNACTFNQLDVNNMALVDIEYLFLKIRSKSVGETASPAVKCSKCMKLTETKVDLSKIEPTYDENHQSKFSITDDLVIEMRYPKFTDIEHIQNKQNEVDKIIGMIISCIDKIHTKNTTINAIDCERSELVDFVSNFTQEQFKKLTVFVETMPKLESKVNFTCSHCGHKENFILEGIKDFF